VTALIRAAGLAGYEEFANTLGIDVARAVRRAGLSLKALRDPNALIPYHGLMKLLEQTAQLARCPDLGLRLSQRQGIDILGPLALAMQHASTVLEAMQLGSRYVFVHSNAIRFSVVPVAGHAQLTDLRFAIVIPNLHPQPQTLELSLGVIAQILQLLGQGSLQPAMVLLPHTRIAPLPSYARCFACPCKFGQVHAAVRVPTEGLSRPLPGHNAMLCEVARTYLDVRFPRPDHALADRVRLLLRESIGTRRSSHEDVAKTLAMHPRTLQRRLRDEGTRFNALKDEVRRTLLEQLVEQSTALSLSQVAAMLDYAEQSALTRSCRRWFGEKPSALRNARTWIHRSDKAHSPDKQDS
jgi:AraC-like DNA-binding protein